MRCGAGAVLAAGCLHTPGRGMALPGAAPGQGANAKLYVCPPCGLPCDKLTFDHPGNCPQCGRTLIPSEG